MIRQEVNSGSILEIRLVGRAGLNQGVLLQKLLSSRLITATRFIPVLFHEDGSISER